MTDLEQRRIKKMALANSRVEMAQSSKLRTAVAAALLRTSERYDKRAEANAADSSLADELLARSKRTKISIGLRVVCGTGAAAA